jgi:hypothetical protein
MVREIVRTADIGLEKLAPLVREIGWSHNLAIVFQAAL